MTNAIARLGFMLAAGLAVAGCRSERKFRDYRVDGARAYKLVEEIVAIGPRPSGSSGAKRTVDYIAGKCREYGYEPRIDEWTETTDAGEITFRNVYADLDGRGRKFVVLGTHYDTKVLPDLPLFVGANDSGSSTGLVLEIMRLLKKGDWDGPPVRFAFFDGEECLERYGEKDGLHGSKRMVRRLQQSNQVKRCRAMILLDMIGDKDLQITLPADDDEDLVQEVLAIAREQGVENHFRRHRNAVIDDHVPFKRAGIPAVDLIDFEFGPNNTYWHTNADTLDKISEDSLRIVGNVTIRLLQRQRK